MQGFVPSRADADLELRLPSGLSTGTLGRKAGVGTGGVGVGVKEVIGRFSALK